MQEIEPPPHPPGSGPVFRAAQYVRMSTEHQQYSTENQGDKIREYAAVVYQACKVTCMKITRPWPSALPP